ncbi:MAG: CsgG/HfaB family protein [Candidatus Omnitrophica bacterium]|nr:CsgG/HfaB family protein [Candidatus Omnitrophota bacterium]
MRPSLNRRSDYRKKEKINSFSEALSGPKKTIAVTEFTNASGLGSYINLGDDFSAQLTDSLIQSGAFIVLSRTELSSIVGEQDLSASGRTAVSQTAQIGKIIPAQILIKGNITEFDKNKESGGQGLTISGVTIGAKKSNAHIAVILQIIDSTTGEVIDSKRIEGDAQDSGFAIGYEGSWSIGSSSFKKTPLGKATQIAIDRAVVYIADKLSSVPWQGRVVTVKDSIVYLNAGEKTGISQGQTFTVYRKGETLVDPETGVELGSEKTKIGEISITEIEEKFSKAKIITSTQEIKRSDLILEN